MLIFPPAGVMSAPPLCFYSRNGLPMGSRACKSPILLVFAPQLTPTAWPLSSLPLAGRRELRLPPIRLSFDHQHARVPGGDGAARCATFDGFRHAGTTIRTKVSIWNIANFAAAGKPPMFSLAPPEPPVEARALALCSVRNCSGTSASQASNQLAR